MVIKSALSWDEAVYWASRIKPVTFKLYSDGVRRLHYLPAETDIARSFPIDAAAGSQKALGIMTLATHTIYVPKRAEAMPSLMEIFCRMPAYKREQACALRVDKTPNKEDAALFSAESGSFLVPVSVILYRGVVREDVARRPVICRGKSYSRRDINRIAARIAQKAHN